MMNTGLTFGSEGPMMEGTWYNTRTGDSFTVRDSFFEDNQFVVTTTDGRYLKYEQIQDYIKSDKPIEMKKPEPKQEVLPAEVADLIEDTNYDDMIMADDLAMLQGHAPGVSLGNLNDNSSNKYAQGSAPSSNYDIINKALSKRTLPDFQIGIDWLACPVKEIEMLMTLMDVEEHEIVNWYLSQVDVSTTTLMIKEVIRDYLMEQLHPAVNEDAQVVELVQQIQDTNTVAKPAKKATKKTKK